MHYVFPDHQCNQMDKHPGNKSPWRPASSLGNSTSWTIQDSPMNASENCDKEKDETCQRPVSHASSRHLRPTSAASCLMPKGISHSAALSEATTFRNAVKIASTTHSAGSGQKTSDDLASTRTTVGTKRSAVSPEGRWAPSLHSTSNSNYLDASRNSIRRYIRFLCMPGIIVDNIVRILDFCANAQARTSRQGRQ